MVHCPKYAVKFKRTFSHLSADVRSYTPRNHPVASYAVRDAVRDHQLLSQNFSQELHVNLNGMKN